MVMQMCADTHRMSGVEFVLQSNELLQVCNGDQGRALQISLVDRYLSTYTNTS
jgi:hypothetical protein